MNVEKAAELLIKAIEKLHRQYNAQKGCYTTEADISGAIYYINNALVELEKPGKDKYFDGKS